MYLSKAPQLKPNLRSIQKVFKLMRLLVSIKNAFMKKYKLTNEHYILIDDKSYDKDAKFNFNKKCSFRYIRKYVIQL